MVVGVDEVGRGCWAGPLVAGAVALGRPIPGLKDSKVLSKKKRNELSIQVHAEALSIGIGWVSSSEVDALGLTQAVRLAMQRALEQITVEFEELIIDGNLNFFPNDSRAKAIIKADATVPAVSAASIVAKVARDAWMENEAAKLYPNYHFEKHVGYGTPEHIAALKTYGISEIHRKLYRPIKDILNASAAI